MFIDRVMTATASTAAAGSVLGAITNDQTVTWIGVAVAVVSAVLTAGLAGYHKIREASRNENLADLAAQTAGLTRYISAQLEVERRVAENAKTLAVCEHTLSDLAVRMQLVKFPADAAAAACPTPAPNPNPDP